MTQLKLHASSPRINCNHFLMVFLYSFETRTHKIQQKEFAFVLFTIYLHYLGECLAIGPPPTTLFGKVNILIHITYEILQQQFITKCLNLECKQYI